MAEGGTAGGMMVAQLTMCDKMRVGRATRTTDRYGDFKGKKGVGFAEYRKSLYGAAE